LAGLLADRAGYGSVFLIGGVAAAIGFLIALLLRHAQEAVSHRTPVSPSAVASSPSSR